MYGPTNGDILFVVVVVFGFGVLAGVLGHIGWQHLHLSLGWR